MSEVWQWKKLPREVMKCPSLAVFKKNLGQDLLVTIKADSYKVKWSDQMTYKIFLNLYDSSAFFWLSE